MPKRSELLQRLENDHYDIVVVGGGITGCGVARDAARRGLRVALIEARDVAYGTSSRSSKLIHGGLRYLEQLEIGLVWEAVNERRNLERLAPHLVSAQSFFFPVYKHSPVKFFTLKLGLWVYEALVLFRVPRLHRSFGRARASKQEPLLKTEALKGAALYWDCTTNDARLTLETAIDAQQQGADLATYCKVSEFVRDETGRLTGVKVKDGLSGRSFSISSDCVVNATGPWSDRTRALMGHQGQILRPTKGIHVVVDSGRLPLQHAVVLHHPDDGRILFCVPWGDRTYIGTTDTDYKGRASQVAASGEDVDYLIRSCDFFFPEAKLSRADVIATWAGLRPLISEGDGDASSVSREHQVIVEPEGLITIAGGKLTTYRRMSAEVVDHCVDFLKKQGFQRSLKRSGTEKAVFPGAQEWTKETTVESMATRAVELSEGKLDAECGELLASEYGSSALDIARSIAAEPVLGERLLPDRAEVLAMVDWAVKTEFAMRLSDVMVRRTQLFFKDQDQGLGALDRIADRMGALLAWSPETVQEEKEAYRQEVALSRQWQAE
ncbi:MAG: glycerol-3-phosphate dehydrogenase/oxidase [Myxococcota bacterium]|nr:glycerol-3-phosphate dehydrogenase/oxidase [Myxococcota bacterium]